MKSPSVSCLSFIALVASSSAFTHNQASPRRSSGLFATSRRDVLGAAAAATAAATWVNPAFAQDGPVVELQMANLDGVEGNTGTVKIQLRPEWAPEGVVRFEASLLRCLSLSYARQRLKFISSHHAVSFLYVGIDQAVLLGWLSNVSCAARVYKPVRDKRGPRGSIQMAFSQY